MLNQEKLLLHMAWANQYVLAKLGELSDADWKLKLTKDDWSIRELAGHIVFAAGGYANRVSGISVSTGLNQEMVIPIEKLLEFCATADEILRIHSHKPDEINTYQREGATIERSRSTIISQSIHHATEHRAQISDTLKVHGLRVLDLDEIDLWAFSDFAGEINPVAG